MKEIYEEVKKLKIPELIDCESADMEPAVMLGHLNARIAFIGIQPGKPLENEKNQSYGEVLINSFAGKRFVQPILDKTGLKYEDVYWTNVIKLPAPNNEPPKEEWADACGDILQKQIDELKDLKIIVYVGKFVKEYLTKHPLKTDAKILSIHHYSYLFRTGKYYMIDNLAEKCSALLNQSETICIQTKFNTLYRFYRENGEKKIEVIDFKNYFYINEDDFEITKDYIDNMQRKYEKEQNFEYSSGFKSMDGKNLIKITPNKFEFWKIRKLLWDKEIQTYEYALDVYLKYLLENKIQFSKERKVAVVDIENDMSLDVENTPKLINSITLYDYSLDLWHTWVLQNPGRQPIEMLKESNKNLYIFEDETEMLVDFRDKFREMDFDVVGGWNFLDFDIPYIINRMTKLKINANKLSKFYKIDGAVDTRKFTLHTKTGRRTHFSSQILGMDVLDYISIVQKNTCYDPQPSSWSLKSTAKFYLKPDKQKLTEIGAGSWRDDINGFIKYNIQDVDVNKELIDKFKLNDFFIMIQTEIAPVPLHHVTHNSVILLYYLKFLFPNIMLPDNPGYKYLEDEKIDLKQYRIKMKAAHVIPAIPGIHHHVSIFDFAGLYPSLFKTFNISPETLNEQEGQNLDDIVMWKFKSKEDEISNDVDDDEEIKPNEIIKEYAFEKKFIQNTKGLYPILLENLTNKRNIHKTKKKEFEKLYGEDDIRTRLEKYRSDVVKNLQNSLYGICGYNKTVLFNPQVGASVTSVSRKLIKHVKSWVEEECNFKVITGDTDSCMIEHNKELDINDFERKLNNEIKRFVFEIFPNLNKENYAIKFEYAKTFDPFVMKEAKKKYYGYISSEIGKGDFYCKGFPIIQHVLSDKVKTIIKDMYLNLMETQDVEKLRYILSQHKKDFYSFSYEDLRQELKLSNDPEEYTTNVRHSRAASYCNEYLGTHFKGGDTGWLIYIKNIKKSEHNYPKTDLLFLDENTQLPCEFEIDYDLSWEKLIIDNIKLLDSVPGMKVNEILSKNKSILAFI